MDFWIPSLTESLDFYYTVDSRPFYLLLGPKNYKKTEFLLDYLKLKKHNHLTISLQEISKNEEISASILEYIRKPSTDVSIESLTKNMILQTKHKEMSIILTDVTSNQDTFKKLFSYIEKLLLINTFLTYKLKLILVLDLFPTCIIPNNFKLMVNENSFMFTVPSINKEILIKEIEITIVNTLKELSNINNKNNKMFKHKKQNIIKFKNKTADYISSALFNTITDPGFYINTTKRIVLNFVNDSKEDDFLYYWKKEVTGIITNCLTNNSIKRKYKVCEDISTLSNTECLLYLAVFWCSNINKYFDDNVFSIKKEGKQILKNKTKTKYFTKERLYKIYKRIGSNYVDVFTIDNRAVVNVVNSFKLNKILYETKNGKFLSSNIKFNDVFAIANRINIKIQNWKLYMK